MHLQPSEVLDLNPSSDESRKKLLGRIRPRTPTTPQGGPLHPHPNCQRTRGEGGEIRPSAINPRFEKQNNIFYPKFQNIFKIISLKNNRFLFFIYAENVSQFGF
jgi:hypothetical protein